MAQEISPCVTIDPRSYHVFQFKGSNLLFDRATGATMKINEFAYDSLLLLGTHSVEAAEQQLTSQYPGLAPGSLSTIIEEMRGLGMFRYAPVDPSAQERYLESLWWHRPYRIQMLMAQGCNLGCRYCYAWRNGSNQKHTLMPWSIARQTVDYLVWRSGERQTLQITFFGGEPLLNFEVIKQVVAYCRKVEAATGKRFVFELCTNATLMDKDVVDFLVAHRFLLFISIDGWREMHNHNRPSMQKDDLYDTIVANAKYAHEQYRANGLGVPKVRANLTRGFADRRAVADYLESLGFGNVEVGSIEPLPHEDPSPAALTEEQVDALQQVFIDEIVDDIELVKQGGRLTGSRAKQFMYTTAPREKVSAVGVTCGIGRNTLIVDNKGNFFPCHRYEGMNAYILGNVFTGLDRERVMGYYRSLSGHATAHCNDCWIRDYCGGGCVWLLSSKKGHIADPTERECARRGRSIEVSLWARAELREHRPDLFESDTEVSLDRWNEEPLAKGTPTGRTVRLSVLSHSPVA